MLFMTHFPDLSRRKRITLAELNDADDERRLRGIGLLAQLDLMGLVPYQTLPEVDSLDGFLFDPEAIKVGDREICAQHRFIFLSKWRGATTTAIAIADPTYTEPIERFVSSWFSGSMMDPVIVPAPAIEAAIRCVYHRSWVAPERPTKRPEDERLLPLIESVAKSYYARLTGLAKDSAIRSITDLFAEQGHHWSSRILLGSRDIPCAFCNRKPSSGFYTNVTHAQPPHKAPPTFVCTIGSGNPVEPALCHDCVTRDWKIWEADMEAVLSVLRNGDTNQRIAADVLSKRFARRKIRIASGECTFCGRRGQGLQGVRAFACAKCADEAKRVFRTAHRAMIQRMDDARKAEEEEKNRPFPPEMRQEARRIAAVVGQRRAKALQLPPEDPSLLPVGEADRAWDDVRRWFKEEPTSYIYMEAFRERAHASPPPPDVVDMVASGAATLIESVALDGYRKRHKGMLSSDNAVVGNRWPAHLASGLLYQYRLSILRRARLDEAIVLLRMVLDSGIHYCEWDDGAYDDVTEPYANLTAQLYDFRKPLSSSLGEGALLLHGRNAEERLEVARETHLSRTGGSDADNKMYFVVVGPSEEGLTPLVKDFGNSTVYIPNPLALSTEEQAYLEDRLTPTGPPKPTILGADDEEAFRQGAFGAFRRRLLERLYTFEYDLRREWR